MLVDSAARGLVLVVWRERLVLVVIRLNSWVLRSMRMRRWRCRKQLVDCGNSRERRMGMGAYVGARRWTDRIGWYCCTSCNVFIFCAREEWVLIDWCYARWISELYEELGLCCIFGRFLAERGVANACLLYYFALLLCYSARKLGSEREKDILAMAAGYGC